MISFVKMNTPKLVLALTILFCVFNFTHAQLQLHVDDNGELAAFQADLSQGQGGLMNFIRSPSNPLGYLGIHPNRPSDIELGTSLDSEGQVTFTILSAPKLTITHIGNVRIANMFGSNFGQLFASPDGEISVLEGEQVHTVHYAQFRPSSFEDGVEGALDDAVDGEFIEIVQPIDEVEFVRHQKDEGVLSAPIHIPRGAIITKLKVYYINLASDDTASNRFEVCIERAFSDANFVFQDRTPWLELPVDGNLFTGSFGDNVVIATRELDVAPISVNFSNAYYNVIVRCKECSDQYIRAVDVVYKFK